MKPRHFLELIRLLLGPSAGLQHYHHQLMILLVFQPDLFPRAHCKDNVVNKNNVRI